MRLTLDWDTPAEQAEHLDTVRRAAEAVDQPWQLRRSAGGEGYHFIAWGLFNDTPAGVRAAFNQRGRWGDDARRLDLDRERWSLGSPFTNLLYRRKYVSRTDRPPYETGNVSTIIAGHLIRDADERLKSDEGRLMYGMLLDRAVADLGAAEVARRTGLKSYADDRGGRSASTVRRYARGEGDLDGLPSEHPIKRVLRRAARSRGWGHFISDPSGGRSADADEGVSVEYLDRSASRRTVVEYLDVPWGTQPAEGEDREYKLAQIETGTFNENHTDAQLRYAHDRAAEAVREAMSPTAPDDLPGPYAGKTLDLTRHPDSIFIENEVMDPNEPAAHAENVATVAVVEADDVLPHIVTEVLLWDDDLADVEWHVLLLDDGDEWDEHRVLVDEKGWWPA